MLQGTAAPINAKLTQARIQFSIPLSNYQIIKLANYSSANAFAALIAFCHPLVSAPALLLSGEKLLLSFHCFLISSIFFQKPTASPARYAAPMAVVSVISGLITVAC